jgi:hypothetical protein
MSAATMECAKVAWIRDQSVPAGQPAPGRLNCRCGNAPVSRYEPSQGRVHCACGKVYSWNGWRLKAYEFHSVTVHLEDGTSYQTPVNGARTHDEIRAYFVGATFDRSNNPDAPEKPEDFKRCVRVEIVSP